MERLFLILLAIILIANSKFQEGSNCLIYDNSISNFAENILNEEEFVNSKTISIIDYLERDLADCLFLKDLELSKEGDTLAIIGSSMFFPYVYDEKNGITLIYPNNEIENRARYIIIDENNCTDFNIDGAKPGMNFDEIQHFLGELNITETWIANKENIAYSMNKQIGNILYQFVSLNPDGKDSVLYISMTN